MSADDFSELARAKLVKVLGPEHGERLFGTTMRELGVERLTSPEGLHRFSQRLVVRGGIIGATGAMLGLMAVMRGAQGTTEEPG